MKLITLLLIFIIFCIPSKAQENSIVINEIMADPSPCIKLPEYEYVELFNTTDSSINVKNWKLIIGKKEFSFKEETVIQPNDFLILCHEDAFEGMSQYGNCYSFSSFQITNTGTNITLIDNNDLLISSTKFDISWHSTSYKEEGGWSLEQIDAYNPCAGKTNWGSSNNKQGGTPGSDNSIRSENIIPPKLDYICVTSNNSIELFFNQNMDITNLQNIDNYIITEMQLHPTEANLTPFENNHIQLIFDYNFEEGMLYNLNVNNVKNCKDIEIEEEINITFGVPFPAKPQDVVINEILFNPIYPASDYLELYNRSQKVIDLSSLMFGTIKKSFPNPADTTVKDICTESRILNPGAYVLISLNGGIIKYQYDSPSENFIDVKSFPSFTNEDGIVIICNKNREIIDKIHYSEKMHYELLAETQGVALERISSEQPSLDDNNWHSASYNVNYGTPGYKNSMTIDSYNTANTNEIKINPEIFSPDGDAYDDICSVYYNFQENCYSMNIKVFNSQGILVRNLLKNNLVNNEGVVFWDGNNDNKQIVSPGIYIIQVEIFDLKGFVERMRKTVVVATK